MDLVSFVSGQIIGRAYSLKERNRLFSHLRELEQTQWFPLAQIQERQLNRLKRLLIHAFETVDFYRKRFFEIGFNPIKFEDFNQLKILPLLTKKNIIENVDSLISKKYPPEKLVKSRTGGSTGTQLHFYINKESVDEKNACAWRHNRWANWDLGMPVAALWGNPPKPTTFKEKLRRKILDRYIYLDTMSMNISSMNEFAQKISQMGRYVLYGHSHSLYLFSEFLKSNGIVIKSPVAIISTSMMLMDNERSLIEEVFKQKVTDRYGCEEVSLIGSECERHNGMHLNIDHLFIEFVKDDGVFAAPGEQGKIVVTDLTNYGMPFIRYEVGDVGVPSDRDCPCGRGLPLMEKVIGRIADFLVRKDGSLVAGVSLIERLLTNIPGIHQMQIVQNHRDRLLLRMVKESNFKNDLTMQQLREEFDKAFPGTTMEVEFLTGIPQELSGKYRFAICNIKNEL